MELSRRYQATVHIPKGLTGVEGLITALTRDYPAVEVKAGEAFLQGRQHSFSFRQFTKLGERKFSVRGDVTVSTGDPEKIPIKGEFNLNGKGWIERDRGRDPS